MRSQGRAPGCARGARREPGAVADSSTSPFVTWWYAVGGDDELVVEQDQSLHDSRGSCGRARFVSRSCCSATGGSACEASASSSSARARVCSMSAAKLGAENVLLTDHPSALPLLRRTPLWNFPFPDDTDTAVANARDPRTPRVSCLPLDWLDANHLSAVLGTAKEEGPFDVALAADVVFFAKHLVSPMFARRRGGHVARGDPRARRRTCAFRAVRGSVRRVQEGGADGLRELHGAREERRRVRGRRVFRV